MRFAEKHKVKKLILLSCWDFNDLTPEHRLFWEKTIDHSTIKENAQGIIIISSDNDPYVTKYHAEEMSKRLGGKFVLVKNAGHFLSEDGFTSVPEILDYID